ncbi:sulfur carrier protein ThiS [Sulfurovum sp. bin170]|nr:sulfur carrier protein ThiS [Sulfurovum sp. bin170]
MISVNGEIKEFKGEHISIKELLEEMSYSKGIAVALNETFVLKTKYKETIIKDGDRLDILSPVQGG